jgi:NapC/NirT cytochrome c family, N-terminal region
LILGLLLIPLGIARQRRRDRAVMERGEAPPAFPVFNLNDPRTRNRLVVFIALTAINVVILSAATYKGVETMDSTEFCGEACHSVMQPEYAAYQVSPHANVGCTECHIGPGADWFVKSKLSGAWQVVSVNLDLYPRPIPTPVHNLRPARETCEQCHWPSKFVGDRLRVINTYSDDEANTPLKTVLLMRVGGQQGRTSHGIHWHVDPGIQIRYLSDESRKTIYEVELRADKGETRRYTVEGQKPPAGAVWRTMDCVDCHNRPSHVFKLPERAVDDALVAGRIPRDLPYVRREGVRLLEAGYPLARGRHEGHRGGPAGLLSERESAGRHRPDGGHRSGGRRPRRDLSHQRVPLDEGRLGSLSEPHRPRNLSGLFPLPRRFPCHGGRPDHLPGLLHLPRPAGSTGGEPGDPPDLAAIKAGASRRHRLNGCS